MNVRSVVFRLLIGGDTVRGCTHLSVACHLVVYDMKGKKGILETWAKHVRDINDSFQLNVSSF